MHDCRQFRAQSAQLSPVESVEHVQMHIHMSLLVYYCMQASAVDVNIKQKGFYFFLLTPCLTRSALIKSSPEPRHLTDTNPLQKTTPEPISTVGSLPVSLFSSVNKLALT